MTKIWVHGDRLFAVTVAVTNQTKYAIRFFPATGPDDPAYIPRPGFGIGWREPAPRNIHTRRLRTVVPRTFSHSLPTKPLRVGETLNVTFSGRSRLLRTHRADGAPRKTLNGNRLALVAAIRALNRSLLATHLGGVPAAP